MEVCTHKQYPQYFPLITGRGGGKGIICFLDKISIRMISDLFFAGWNKMSSVYPIRMCSAIMFPKELKPSQLWEDVTCVAIAL